MKNEIIETDIINIEKMIYEIDGKEVMLDSDLGKLYHVETKRINEAVKNNPDKFPKRYSFILSDEEKKNLWSKFSTANISTKSRSNPYANKDLLDILRKIKRKIIIVSKNIDDVLIKKYESQYKNVTFIKNDSFHDRFIILDRNKLYSCGSSLKDVGKKCFAINEFEDSYFINDILKNINI